MNLFRDAFGQYDPLGDPDVGAKVALEAIGRTDSLADLTSLFAENSRVGGLEGDPGWTIERRRPLGSTAPGYKDWPGEAEFRVFVDPGAMALTHQERYYRGSDLLPLVHALAGAYPATTAVQRNAVAALRAAIAEYGELCEDARTLDHFSTIADNALLAVPPR